MSFDYGEKREDGQFERYPTNNEGEFVAPIRKSYIHNKCGVVTGISMGIAETYARNPKYYSHTFCVGCKDHFPIEEFKWDDGYDTTLGEIGPSREERKLMKLYSMKRMYIDEIMKNQNHLIDIENQIKEMEGKNSNENCNDK